jgi:hypothetical protein
MRAVLIGAISTIVSAGLLFAAFPFSTFYDGFQHSRVGITLESYLLVALLVGLIVAAIVFVLSHYLKTYPLGLGILTGIVSLIVLIVGSILMGPYQWDIPGTEVHFFFSEWNFTGFICQVAFPVSLLAGALVWWDAQRKKRLIAKS